jgi:hypothetical protein
VKLTDKQIAEYCYRSYTAADGLWFMKVEERYGFEIALEIDNEVWKVMPKIQARKLKSLMKMGNGIEALSECLTTKLSLEGYAFKTEDIKSGDGFRIIIEKCPWHNLMVKSGRKELSGKVGSCICNTEFPVWASEFGENISFELKNQICTGSERCVIEFSH